ncbi:hypothetical protein V6N13_001734 [Hibiscus sabdariffa]
MSHSLVSDKQFEEDSSLFKSQTLQFVTDRTLGAMSSAPKGVLAATSTYGTVRDVIYSLLGLHPGFRPGPPLGAPEASTTDMATGSPSQYTSF